MYDDDDNNYIHNDDDDDDNDDSNDNDKDDDDGHPGTVWLREWLCPNSSGPISLLAARPVLEAEADAHLVDCPSR